MTSQVRSSLFFFLNYGCLFTRHVPVEATPCNPPLKISRVSTQHLILQHNTSCSWLLLIAPKVLAKLLVSSFASFWLNTWKYVSLWKVVTIPPILAFRIVHKQFSPNAKFAIKDGEFVLYHTAKRRSMSLITGNITLNQSVALKQCRAAWGGRGVCVRGVVWGYFALCPGTSDWYTYNGTNRVHCLVLTLTHALWQTLVHERLRFRNGFYSYQH